MTDSPKHWDEKEWEEYANKLASTHHAIVGGSYQRIPDLEGDRGLEGLTDRGEAYQAYADQDSKDNADRTRKQKRKIREDLNKLEKYIDFWSEFLGDRKLKQWTLIVPDFDDKEVAQYAKARGRAMVKKNLSILDPTFFVDVKSAADFPVAVELLKCPVLPKKLSFPATPDQIATFEGTQPDFIANLNRKLLASATGYRSDQIRNNAKKWLEWHLESTNLLDYLDAEFPEVWELVDEMIEHMGKAIETDGLLDTRQPADRIRETRKEIEAKLEREKFKFLTEQDRSSIAFGSVAKWLGECPLDFPETINGD
ncbi:MAG: hypothetical protein ACE361_01285 [Aureliella sp.]